LTAGVIAAEHGVGAGGDLEITVVESPEVGPIGVGEGTWPSMRDTLRRIGLSETALFREADAAFKQGSKFVGWVTGNAGDAYYHPFVMPHGYLDVDLAAQWRRHCDATPFASVVSCQPHLCESGRAPKQVTTPEFAAVANYAYHLDAGKFGALLQRHCIERLGVRLVRDHVTGIEADDAGDIAALATREHGRLAGDLFVDCTGAAALLVGKHYRVPVESRRDVLFNDSALAVQVPYAAVDAPVACNTISTACRAGWIWDIGLPTRRGIGHVYSSAHSDDEDAERNLRAYVAATANPAAAASMAVRKLTFTPGYRLTPWHRNCVAVGMSSGFIEPLEASALALVEFSAAMIRDQMPATRSMMEIVARRFNDAFSYRWERVIDFLKLHYVLSKRSDSPYWNDHRASTSVPARLQELLVLWRDHTPSRYDLVRIEEIFPSASYQYVLYGMGFRTNLPSAPRRSENPILAAQLFAEVSEQTRKMLGALPDHRALLEHLGRHPFQKV
jgi:hypothetical protein